MKLGIFLTSKVNGITLSLKTRLITRDKEMQDLEGIFLTLLIIQFEVGQGKIGLSVNLIKMIYEDLILWMSFS